jgi:hypothetical protein
MQLVGFDTFLAVAQNYSTNAITSKEGINEENNK